MGLARPCIEQGCPNIVTEGSRCPGCEQIALQRDRARRGSAAERGYDAAWVAVRDAYAHEHPLCEDHLERGETVAMTVVDHTIPLPYGPRLDPKNLRSLCDPCHGAKTERDRAAGYNANVAPAREEQQRWIVA